MAVSATVVGLAACGSSPKISSSDFVSKCTSDKSLSTAVKQIPGGAGKVDSLCHCVQSKMVALGLGDRSVDDQSTAVKNGGRTAALACLRQVLSGGG
jgi:hypothetical protein